ncbi:uncharacterized protein [Malus domestica]|uniref:uncharacterized protein n=1 Tax=Malus domestica TaxID=3750 RepID=UPI003975F1B2
MDPRLWYCGKLVDFRSLLDTLALDLYLSDLFDLEPKGGIEVQGNYCESLGVKGTFHCCILSIFVHGSKIPDRFNYRSMGVFNHNFLKVSKSLGILRKELDLNGFVIWWILEDFKVICIPKSLANLTSTLETLRHVERAALSSRERLLLPRNMGSKGVHLELQGSDFRVDGRVQLMTPNCYMMLYQGRTDLKFQKVNFF